VDAKSVDLKPSAKSASSASIVEGEPEPIDPSHPFRAASRARGG